MDQMTVTQLMIGALLSRRLPFHARADPENAWTGDCRWPEPQTPRNYLIGDGRISLGTRLPSERELTDALGVSRTTVTRAYAALRDAGYAEARQGSGTFTRVPGGRSRAHDRALMPGPGDERRDRPELRGRLGSPGARGGLRRGGGRAAGVLRRARLLPRRPAPAAGRDRRDVRRPRPADRPGPDHGHAGRAERGLGRGAGVHRSGRPGARRVAGLPERDAGDPAQRRPARGLAGRPRRLGPRRRRRRPAADLAEAGVPDPRLPEPDRPPDDRRPARGVRRPPAPHPHRRRGRRGAPGAGARGPGDAAAVRGVRAGHDHDRQRQQVLLGRPAPRLDPRARAARWSG